MNILLLTIGSAGDVHPFIGIGQALGRRGHRVRMICNPHFASAIQGAGLELIPLGEPSDYESLLGDPDLWHRRKALGTVFGAVLGGLRHVYDAVTNNYIPGQTVIAASSLALGARVAQDKFDLPLATIHLAPAIFRSVHQAPKLPGAPPMPDWLPKQIKQAIFSFGERFLADPKICPALNAFRAEVGLPPVRGVLSSWWHSPRRVIGLFPNWFAPPQPDWPPQTRLTGFPLYDQSDISPIAPEISDFLAAGPPPVLFTPGSAMHHAHSFFQHSVEACRRLNCRAIFLTRHAEQIPANLPPTIRHFPYVPFSKVFPRAAVIVHHGGIGTSAQAMAAGVPQIVTPFCHDQLDNADRMQRLGVSRTLNPNRYRTRKLAPLLQQVLNDRSMADTARRIAQRLANQNSIEQTCDLIEEMKFNGGR